jgi:hypothetical protein
MKTQLKKTAQPRQPDAAMKRENARLKKKVRELQAKLDQFTPPLLGKPGETKDSYAELFGG